jgi:hypothetical protein
MHELRIRRKRTNVTELHRIADDSQRLNLFNYEVDCAIWKVNLPVHVLGSNGGRKLRKAKTVGSISCLKSVLS